MTKSKGLGLYVITTTQHLLSEKSVTAFDDSVYDPRVKHVIS